MDCGTHKDMSIFARMTKILEGLPSYKSKPEQKGNSKGGPATTADDVDMAINGTGRTKPMALPTPGQNSSKGLQAVAKQAAKDTGAGKGRDKGYGIGVKGRMESLLGR